MTITETISLLREAEKRAGKRSQKKHYKTFTAILTDLQTKELDEDQFLMIEKQLDNLQLSSTVPFKKLNGNFSKLKEFLKVKFSLTTEGYYTSLGIALGMCFGLAFGSLIDRYIGSSVGLTLGMAAGIVIGKKMDSDAEVHGNSLKTTLQ